MLKDTLDLQFRVGDRLIGLYWFVQFIMSIDGVNISFCIFLVSDTFVWCSFVYVSMVVFPTNLDDFVSIFMYPNWIPVIPQLRPFSE